jgi:hypothetical protein
MWPRLGVESELPLSLDDGLDPVRGPISFASSSQTTGGRPPFSPKATQVEVDFRTKMGDG